MIYAQRRALALDGFAGGVAVIPAARIVLRNGDNDFSFRQNSDFFYLTGFDEPDAVLVLAPHHEAHRTVLFLNERDRAQEIWTGKRLGVEAAADALGVDAAFSIADLDERLPEYLAGARTMHYALGDEERDRRIRAALNAAHARTRRKGHAPEVVADPGLVLHALRSIKTPEEIATLRRGAEIARRGHEAAMRATHPGAYEYEIAALLEYEYRRAGAQGVAYDSIVAGGDNALYLHYNTNRDELRDGTLLLVDSGCELDYYAIDVTRTWPVNGRFSAEQRAIYEVVLAAHGAACAQVRPDNPQRAFHEAAVRTLVAGLIDLGLLGGGVDENLENEAYRAFYMHGTGHWLGLDVHDAGRYRDDEDRPVRLQPGMVTTVEPGLYVHRDADCDERFKGIGVRIEDDVLVTPTGHENLTAAIPREVAALEAIVGRASCE